MPSKIYLLEETPTPFDFEATVRTHGWFMLQPFGWHQESATLSRVHCLASGKVICLWLQEDEASNAAVKIGVDTNEPLTSLETAEIKQAVRRMLRLDETFDEFYELAERLDGHDLRLKPGAGRLLRCPTLFEDMIYTLCTTNISWSGTRRMVKGLTETLGQSFPGNEAWQAFPSPEAIAEVGAEFLKRETGLGYRSEYVWLLARDVAEGQLDLSQLEDPARSTDSLYKSVRQLKGFGDYAASTVLMLLGRYDRLAIDSELRAFVTQKHFNGQPPAGDKEFQAIYAPWGRWRYLAYWFDYLPI